MRAAGVLLAACAVACSSESKHESKQAPPGEPAPASGEPAAASGVTLDPEDAPKRKVPPEPPVITYGYGGGMNYLDFSSTQIWADGMVHFAARNGGGCGRTPSRDYDKVMRTLDRAIGRRPC